MGIPEMIRDIMLVAIGFCLAVNLYLLWYWLTAPIVLPLPLTNGGIFI